MTKIEKAIKKALETKEEIQKLKLMDFRAVTNIAKHGFCIFIRKSKEHEQKYIYAVPSEDCTQYAVEEKLFGKKETFVVEEHWRVYSKKDGTTRPWNPTNEDLFATDWWAIAVDDEDDIEDDDEG